VNITNGEVCANGPVQYWFGFIVSSIMPQYDIDIVFVVK